ncbi:MAG: L,D-transpeptidase [Clostridia bacterium]|nr:L,D-transpeptidase [Clostridia bacterium]
MKKRVFSMLLVFVLMFTSSIAVSAEDVEVQDAVEVQDEAEAVLTSDKFTLFVDVVQPDGQILPSDMRFNIFTEEGEWLANRCVRIESAGVVEVEFQLPAYEIGTRFVLVPTTGVEYITYYSTNLGLNESFVVETYAYVDVFGGVRIADSAHVSAYPFFEADSWEAKAEELVNSRNIQSETPYMIWVSKENFTVSVFLRENNRWECIKYFGCSIGAPDTPTVTGQYKYYRFENIWDYGTYYVGPIIKFYNGYAIHTTLINKDGTDYDGRIGKMISHGCVRVRPENMDWLIFYIPLNTRIYVTNE